MTNALSFEGLGHAYEAERWIFRGLSGALPTGHVLSILGPNGRGKTTLLKTLLGVLKPREGTVTTRGQIAFVPQLFETGFDYSVLDMVLMGRAKRIGLFSQPRASDEKAALAALDKFGLADYAGRAFHELSGGQRQLVIFARALVSKADVLVLDEPTASLDLKNQALVLGWLAHLVDQDGLTIVFTTHQPSHALAIADEVLLMMTAGDYVMGPARAVLTEARLEALYGVALKHLSFSHKGDASEVFVPVQGKRRSRDGDGP